MKLNLALQGGGAHGAFTWGVLDRLLEEEDIEIEGVSGTSAGAINAIVLVEGMIEGGRARARAQLDEFWLEVIRAAELCSPFRRGILDVILGRYTLNNSPFGMSFMMLARAFSPYQLNPANLNPLRDLLERFITFEIVRNQRDIKLFINTTHVTTGALRIFREHEVTADVVLASTTLPQLFQTPIIDGEGYWDGGFIANPAIEPMMGQTKARDVLIVQLNPIARAELPTSAEDIAERVNEITFNSSLITELRFIGERNRLIEAGELSAERHPFLRLHMVHGDHQLASFRNTKLLTEKAFLLKLRDLGRAEMDEFLKAHKDALGQRSSFDHSALVQQMMAPAAT